MRIRLGRASPEPWPGSGDPPSLPAVSTVETCLPIQYWTNGLDWGSVSSESPIRGGHLERGITMTMQTVAIEPSAVLGPDDVLFTRPRAAAARREAVAENVAALRDLLDRSTGIHRGLVTRLVLALVLNPETGTDDRGRLTDAITALGEGEGALRIPPSARSQARAAHVLVSTYDVRSTADPRWSAAVAIAGKAGVGADRIRTAIAGGKAATGRALEQVAETRGDDKRRDVIKSAFPREKDSEDPRSAAFKRADKALDTLRTLLGAADTAWGEGERDVIVQALRAAASL